MVLGPQEMRNQTNLIVVQMTGLHIPHSYTRKALVKSLPHIITNTPWYGRCEGCQIGGNPNLN